MRLLPLNMSIFHLADVGAMPTTTGSQPDAQHKFSAQSGKRLGEDFACFYCLVFSNASTLEEH